METSCAALHKPAGEVTKGCYLVSPRVSENKQVCPLEVAELFVCLLLVFFELLSLSASYFLLTAKVKLNGTSVGAD